jgi:general transcription factor 3C polypeptide 3 (transcription factor C subunit 4)
VIVHLQAFEMLPEDLLVNLCIAVGYLAHAMSKSTGERHSCILKAFAFFSRYASLTVNKQEAAYNLGRAMQQLGLMNLAVEWYERALQMPAAPSRSPTAFESDLRHEAAHNLCLIYNASGAHALAARVMHLYCVV